MGRVAVTPGRSLDSFALGRNEYWHKIGHTLVPKDRVWNELFSLPFAMPSHLSVLNLSVPFPPLRFVFPPRWGSSAAPDPAHSASGGLPAGRPKVSPLDSPSPNAWGYKNSPSRVVGRRAPSYVWFAQGEGRVPTSSAVGLKRQEHGRANPLWNVQPQGCVGRCPGTWGLKIWCA